jgi:formylglycine-generating enzyme required for sulfatase activity
MPDFFIQRVGMFTSHQQDHLACRRAACLIGLLLSLCGLAGCQQIFDRLTAVSASVHPPDTRNKVDSTEAVAVNADQVPAQAKPPLEPLDLRTFRDCSDCPVMVRLPAGSFWMGSPESEMGRDADESPLLRSEVGAFAIGQTEVTRVHWAAFERDSGHRAALGCLTWAGDGYVLAGHLGWRYPGFAQSDEHPVVCINWQDAQAYAQWLSRKTGHVYRLPQEHEWEYAARAGAQTPYPWSGGVAEICAHANGADATLSLKQPHWPAQSCDDGHAFTSPVGSYTPNAWGLYDMQGNAMEWVQDCWRSTLDRPDSAMAPLNCSSRVIRGGGWDLPAHHLRSARRGKASPLNRGTATGFRLVRQLP